MFEGWVNHCPVTLPLLFITLGGAAFALTWWIGQTRQATAPSFDKIDTQIIACDGWNIRYHQSGRGPDLLLLHGIGANLFCWRWIIPFLAKTFRVTAIDLPGFGQSSKPLGAKYGLDDQAERLKKICDQLGLRSTYIVGNSMGGNIAFWFALLYPQSVKGLAVIAPATSPWLVPLPLERLAFLSKPASLLLTRQAMKWAHGRTVSRANLVDKDRIEETFRTYGRKSSAVRSFLMATTAIRDARLLGRLKDLGKPVLILWGSRDRLVNRAVIDELESVLLHSESHIHLGGGHHLQEDEPEWVAEKLKAFFGAHTH